MPTLEQTVRDLVQNLKSKELYFYHDKKCFEFIKANPGNDDELLIFEKLSAMNNGIIEHELVHTFVDHIIKLPLDEALENGDLNIVSKMSCVRENKPYEFRKLASTYCNFHRPEIYPIQTDIAEDLFTLYLNNIDTTHGLPYDLIPYQNFTEVCNHFMSKYDLRSFNYYELEKFLWLNARMIREYFEDPDRDQRFSD